MSTYKGNGFSLPQLPGYIPRILTTFVLVAVLFAVGGTSVDAQKDNGYWFKVQQIEAGEMGLSRIAGIAYDAPSGALILVEETADTSKARIWKIDRYGNQIEVLDIPLEEYDLSIQDSYINSSQLFLLDAPHRQLLEIQTGADQSLSEANPRVKNHPDRPFGVSDLLGVSSDPINGKLFVLDSDGPAILSITLSSSEEPGSGELQSQPLIERIPLHGTAGHSLKGLAYHPDLQYFYVYSERDQMLFAFDQSGQVQDTLELSELGIVDLYGMVFANSTDPTDDPRQVNLFIADGGNSSSVIELSITEVIPLASLPNPIRTNLVRVIDTSSWSPPSPDTSGLEYLIGSNRLLAADSEVDEMGIYQGKNIFTATNSGVLVESCTTLPFSNEPTGIAVNPANNHIFITDDNSAKVFEINPGTDNSYCSADDTFTSFLTSRFNSSDPEGIAYGNGKLYIVDGIGAEAYVLSPGGNGKFDGPAPDGDDQVTHFDTSVMGLRDPEGIGFHWERGTVFIVSFSDNIAVEATENGAVNNIYDFTSANIVSPAGAAIGPGSVNPGEMNLYVSDRGIDNGEDPRENDGKIFELNFGEANLPTWTPTLPSTPTATDTPRPSSTPTNTPTATPTLPGFGTISSKVSVSSDDAEEVISRGKVYLTSSDLNLGLDGSNPQWVGMRFNNIDIPNGATITNAYVEFEVDEIGTTPTSITIYGQASGNAATFTNASYNLSSRPRTISQVAWNSIPSWAMLNAKWQTPDLSGIIMEIISRADWVGGNSIVILISGSGQRTAESFNGEASAAAKLVISYTTNGLPEATNTHTPATVSPTDTLVPPTIIPTESPLPPTATKTPIPSGTPMNTPTATPTPLGNGMISSQINASTNDAEEEISSGIVDLYSSDLELGADAGVLQWVGMRFNNIAIPNGATITNAYVEFEVDEIGTTPTSTTIYGQASGSAATFSTAAFNLSSRPRTTAQVAWNSIPSWIALDAKWQTPDISNIIAEITSRADWAAGNSIVILINGTGRRTAESFNGEPSAAPKLVITYSIN